jgi:hypothetical protein
MNITEFINSTVTELRAAYLISILQVIEDRENIVRVGTTSTPIFDHSSRLLMSRAQKRQRERTMTAQYRAGARIVDIARLNQISRTQCRDSIKRSEYR